MENSKEFKPLSFFREIFLKKDKLGEYYRKKRKYLHEKDELFKNFPLKAKFHKVLLELMSINRRFIDKQSLKILKNESTKTEKPVIYAITHIGKYDYQIVSEAIEEHQIPFSGDPEEMYRTFDGLLLELNGIIYCDTEDKEDRKLAKESSVRLLEKGYNLLIYPEGIWNLSPNLLTLPLFPGIINMALEANVDIVPVGILQYDKEFVVNIGKNYKVNNEKTVDEQRQELRDIMATLKYEIIESRGVEEREKIGDYAKKHRNFVDERLNEWFNKKENKPFYNDEILKHRTYREKNISLPDQVFDYFKKIKLNRNNAFMFRKDESLPEEVQTKIENRIKK